MRTIMMALVICLWITKALAGPLEGQWRVAADSLPTYNGTVIIDAENRVAWDAPLDAGRSAKFRGYIASGREGVEFILTDGTTVVRTRCASAAKDFLRCRNIFPNGKESADFGLARISTDLTVLFAHEIVLEGRWRIETDTTYQYSAIVTISRNGDASLQAAWAANGANPAGSATATGHALPVGREIELLFTKRDPPAASWDNRATCVASSLVSLRCTTPKGRKLTLEKLQ